MVTQWLFFMIAFFGAGTLPDGPFWGEVAEDSGLHGQWQGEPVAIGSRGRSFTIQVSG